MSHHCFMFHGKPLEYTVNDSGMWIFRNIDISKLKLTSLEEFQNVPATMIVTGNFNCCLNKLLSLRGLPENFIVRGNFDCSNSGLSSLSGLPSGFRLGGSFFCHGNYLNLLDIQNLPPAVLEGRTIRRES